MYGGFDLDLKKLDPENVSKNPVQAYNQALMLLATPHISPKMRSFAKTIMKHAWTYMSPETAFAQRRASKYMSVSNASERRRLKEGLLRALRAAPSDEDAAIPVLYRQGYNWESGALPHPSVYRKYKVKHGNLTAEEEAELLASNAKLKQMYTRKAGKYRTSDIAQLGKWYKNGLFSNLTPAERKLVESRMTLYDPTTRPLTDNQLKNLVKMHLQARERTNKMNKLFNARMMSMMADKDIDGITNYLKRQQKALEATYGVNPLIDLDEISESHKAYLDEAKKNQPLFMSLGYDPKKHGSITANMGDMRKTWKEIADEAGNKALSQLVNEYGFT